MDICICTYTYISVCACMHIQIHVAPDTCYLDVVKQVLVSLINDITNRLYYQSSFPFWLFVYSDCENWAELGAFLIKSSAYVQVLLYISQKCLLKTLLLCELWRVGVVQSFRKGLLSPGMCRGLWGYKCEKVVALLSRNFPRKSLKE